MVDTDPGSEPVILTEGKGAQQQNLNGPIISITVCELWQAEVKTASHSRKRNHVTMFAFSVSVSGKCSWFVTLTAIPFL